MEMFAPQKSAAEYSNGQVDGILTNLIHTLLKLSCSAHFLNPPRVSVRRALFAGYLWIDFNGEVKIRNKFQKQCIVADFAASSHFCGEICKCVDLEKKIKILLFIIWRQIRTIWC